MDLKINNPTKRIYALIVGLFLLVISANCSAQLIKAIRNGNVKQVKIMLSQGADMTKRFMGAPPLYWAAYKNNVEIVKLLLDKGADVNDGMANGWKPIHIAVKEGNVEVVKLLIDKGADIYARNSLGDTPLKMAEERGSKLIINLLQDAEIKKDKNISANNDKTTNSVASNQIKINPSDVDFDIPVTKEVKPNTYALIIGNEDYSSFQTDLSAEVNVDYAINDAKVFRDYCTKTLGIPEKQVKLITNATSGQMNQGIAWLNNLAKVDNGKAQLIFYYSGHGLPDEQTKEPYLMPVDISGNNIPLAIKLSDVYSKLNEFPSKKVSVFLDACFSGGARNQGLIAMKGVKVKPKENQIKGNMIVLSSSSGDESSGVYREKQHGYMTYFLLKKFQETKGEVTYKELADFIIESVQKETALESKTQTPQCIYSPSIENIWKNLKLK